MTTDREPWFIIKMINCEKFYKTLIENDIDFFTGVPDSLLRSFSAYITDHTAPEKNIIAANEGGAVALAAGHHLATGKTGLVYMQNSGLGNAVNPLTSLADKDVYSIPVLLLIGWRAEPDVKDEPQHLKMGKITLEMLETMKIPYKILDKNFANTLKEAKIYMKKNSAPFAIVVKKDTFENYQLKTQKEVSNGLTTREEAIKTILPLLEENSIIISTTGMASRELFELREIKKQSHEKDFLTIGSMGHASQIALGIAIEKPEKPVYCFDGDGALIMHMGHLAVIGQLKPENFRHIVFNNLVHDSVGGQPTAAISMDIPKIAKASGYKKVFSVETGKEIIKKINQMKKVAGPVLLEIKVKKGARSDLGRPTGTPKENKKIFTDFLVDRSVRQLKEILIKIKPKNVFLVTGKSSFESSGAKKIFEKLLSAYHITKFSDFSPNPNIDDLEKGLKIFKKRRQDLVLAIGGGSVMDMAKLINIFSVQKGKPTEYIKKEKEINKKGRPLVAIPTTAGSGSEATHFAVIYIDKVKYSVAHQYLLPDYSIVDSAFTTNLPKHITASTGLDALCQAIESYWSINSTEVSKEYSARAIKLAISNLEEAVKISSSRSRQAMSRAAHLAGKAINIAQTTAPHAISYTFTSYFGIPHGHAVGLTLGEIWQYNSEVKENDLTDQRGLKYTKKTMAELCLLLGVSSIAAAKQKIKKLMQAIGLETKLQNLGIKKEDLDFIAKNINLERFGNNPRTIPPKELKVILKIIF